MTSTHGDRRKKDKGPTDKKTKEKKEKKESSHTTATSSVASSSRPSIAASKAADSSSRNDEGYFKKTFDARCTGWMYRMYADVYFGEVDKRSRYCELLVDSGTSAL